MEELRRISTLAVEAMLYEVSATPKPGLVDRDNPGAHRDMDFFTFMTSAAALHDAFLAMAETGYEGRERPVQEILPSLRAAGLEAEQRMFSFTNGVNTHKGMIFNLGLLAGAAGWAIGKEPFSSALACSLVSRMCQGLAERELGALEGKENLTKGERIYLKYGFTGARGEAESGYRTVRLYSLPAYASLRASGMDANDALAETLLHLICHNNDTNILSRHDMTALEYARKAAADALSLGGMRTEKGRRRIKAMDRDFIDKYISPSGSADLLAVTHFLFSLDTVQ